MAVMTTDKRMDNMAAAAIMAALLCTPAAAIAGGSISLEGSTADGRITIDGDSSDWDGLPNVYLENSLRVVAASHDDGQLYVMYRFGDERLAEQLLQRGVILWFNGDGKTKNKDEAFGIRYTGSEAMAAAVDLADPDEHAGPDSEASEHRPPRDMRSLAKQRPDPGTLTVIRHGVKDVIPEGHPPGPNAASAIHDGVFCYEFRIPLAEIGGKVADRNPSKKRTVALGIQIGGTTKAERESIEAALEDSLGRGGGPPAGDVGGMGGGRPGGMGGGGRGGMGGMGGGGRSGPPPDGSDAQKRLNPEIHWVKVEFAPDE